jgi:hypothetical protein
MPVVDAETLTLLASVTADRQFTLVKLPKPMLVAVHDQLPGGEEVAWLESC